jgi:hypothetical protein
MRVGLLIVVLGAALVASSAATADTLERSQWCEVGKNEYLHVQMGRAVVRRGYELDRLPDRTPMLPTEKFALHQHKWCLRAPALRWRIERYRNRVEANYDRFVKAWG